MTSGGRNPDAGPHPDDGDCHDVTRLLQAWSGGDGDAFDRLWPLVYDDLRRRAGSMLRCERAGHTLQATALVHEAYIRLVDQRRVSWQDRRHFFAIAGRMMRRILVDHARQHMAEKRGGSREPLPVDDVVAMVTERGSEVVALDEALARLEALDPEAATVVELRFFVGLSSDETAEVLGCSERTVGRRWSVARAWLFRELNATGEDEL